MRKKVLNKKEIDDLLKQGHFVKWSSIWAYASIVDKTTGKEFGTIRFDTYLKMTLKKIKTPFYSYGDDFYTAE